MKKRLLITSIVMMLVVAVALSTATYAWFTSNASVTANSITMTAAINQAASIGISWTNDNFGTSISAVNSSTAFNPTAYANNDAYRPYDENDWTSATIYQSGSKRYFNAPAIGLETSNLGYVWADGSNHKSFFINNGSTANDIQTLTMTATISGAATDFIRIAVFKKDNGEGESAKFRLKGILTGNYTYTAAGNGVAESGTAYYRSDGSAYELTAGAAIPDDAFFRTGDAEPYTYTTHATGKTTNNVEYYDRNGSLILSGDGTKLIPYGSFTRTVNDTQRKVALGTVAQGTPVAAIDATAQNPEWGTDYCIKEENASLSIDLGGLERQGNNPYVLNHDVMELKVVVWMDGNALNDDTAGTTQKVSSIALNFAAVQGEFTADTFSGS